MRASLLREAAATPDPTDGYGITAGQRGRFDAAAALYEQGNWADAFAHTARLADAGHPPAAKLALLMLRHGAPLFGSGFRADPLHIARWASLVIDASKWKAAAMEASQLVDQRVPLVDALRVPASRAEFRHPTASPSSIAATA